MRSATTVLVLSATVLAVILSGCGGDAAQPRKDEDPAKTAGNGSRVSLILYCGAGIRPAADALIQAFEAKQPVRIRSTYAGSEMLLAQVDAGRKGDLFMPGAESYVDRAIEMGLADAETKRVVAYFVPVIFVRKGNPRGIHSLEDFKREGLRLGLGDERSCAVGRQSLKILEKNQIPYSEIEKNVRFKSATVNELPMQIQLGNLDAVISWDANARHFLDDGDIVPIPLEQNVPSTVPIVRLSSSVAPEVALQFIDFVTSEDGKTILRSKDYTVVLPENEQRKRPVA